MTTHCTLHTRFSWPPAFFADKVSPIARPEGDSRSPAARENREPHQMDLQHITAWAIFLALVLVMLGLDLLVFHRKPHAIKFREALLGALVPVAAACLFAV